MAIQPRCEKCGKFMKFTGMTSNLRGKITEYWSCKCGEMLSKVVTVDED